MLVARNLGQFRLHSYFVAYESSNTDPVESDANLKYKKKKSVKPNKDATEAGAAPKKRRPKKLAVVNNSVKALKVKAYKDTKNVNPAGSQCLFCGCCCFKAFPLRQTLLVLPRSPRALARASIN